MDDRRPPGPGLGEGAADADPRAWVPGRAVIALNDHRRAYDPPSRTEARSGTVMEPLRVLIVEDDDDDFLMVQSLLARAEDTTFLTDRAASSDNGLVRLVEGTYDACLCDLGGSPRGGLEYIRTAMRRGCRTPIILTAGYADVGLQHEVIEAGAVDVLEKEELDTERLDRAIRFAVAREQRIERLSRLVQRDELTGLANSTLFSDRLEQGLAAARRHRTMLTVMIVDLDGFKAVSDQVGHLAGDALLCTVSERLRGRVRATDTVARLGSDEFAVLVEDLSRPDYATLVARKLLEAMAPPIRLDSREVAVTASIGAAIYPRDGTDRTALLRHADAAMYRAKAEGGNLCCFHDERLDTRPQRGAVLGAELRRAIEADELVLHFQPQVTLCAPELGLASLVRWRHPDLGLVEPERIRQLAEDASLLEPLTDWLIMAACRQARRWRDAGLRRLHIAVPLLSRRQLAWSQLASRLQDGLRAAGLPSDWLELEVDERLLLEELASGGAALPPLRELGVRLALDGFGGGSTSLMLLRDAPLTTVKLARIMLQGTPQDSHRTLFAGAVIALAKQLGLRLVAEGIESHAQLQMLRSQGCDAVQAFISCPPLPADACTDWLRQAAHRT
jgi:diguanylate cyclase (GGDEF)-like protein